MTDIATVEAVVSGDIRIKGLAAKPIERLRRALSFPNPEVVKAKRRGVHAGALPDRIEVMVEEPDGSVRLPRGATREIRKALVEDWLKPKYVDERALGAPIEIPKNDALARSRFYQLEAIHEIESHLQGTIVIPCGGGKTTLGVAAIGKLARATLVLVHTEDLLDQWVNTVRTELGIEPGTIQNGQQFNPGAPIVVAMVLTLVRILDTPEGAAWATRFGVVLVDEAHHAPTETFQQAITRLPARIRIGLTATPEREDGKTDLMDWTFGPRLLEVSIETLVKKGHLLRPGFEFPETDFVFDYPPKPDNATERWEAKRMAALQRRLVGYAPRNELIAKIAARQVKDGETVLVLSNHKAHCRALARLIWEMGAEAEVLVSTSGKAAKQARKDKIQGMRDGNVRCIVATSLADEGLDVRRLSRLILALPQRAKGPTTQRLGRIMRPFEGKVPVLYDVIDPLVPTLVNRADERRRTYKKLGLL